MHSAAAGSCSCGLTTDTTRTISPIVTICGNKGRQHGMGNARRQRQTGLCCGVPYHPAPPCPAAHVDLVCALVGPGAVQVVAEPAACAEWMRGRCTSQHGQAWHFCAQHEHVSTSSSPRAVTRTCAAPTERPAPLTAACRGAGWGGAHTAPQTVPTRRTGLRTGLFVCAGAHSRAASGLGLAMPDPKQGFDGGEIVQRSCSRSRPIDQWAATSTSSPPIKMRPPMISHSIACITLFEPDSHCNHGLDMLGARFGYTTVWAVHGRSLGRYKPRTTTPSTGSGTSLPLVSKHTQPSQPHRCICRCRVLHKLVLRPEKAGRGGEVEISACCKLQHPPPLPLPALHS